MTVMRSVVVTLLAASALLSNGNGLTPEEAAQGWISLFDGETLSGWTPEGPVQWRVADGAILAETGEYGWLRHNSVFSDFEFKGEFRTAADGNSGVFIRATPDGAPHLTGYEIQICDRHKYTTGSIVGYAPAKDVPMKPGEWQTLEITALGDRFLVRVDGRPTVALRDNKSRAGHIGLQFSKGKKIEFRNLKLRRVTLRAPE
jgi:hypothetical protein